MPWVRFVTIDEEHEVEVNADHATDNEETRTVPSQHVRIVAAHAMDAVRTFSTSDRQQWTAPAVVAAEEEAMNLAYLKALGLVVADFHLLLAPVR